MSKLKPGKDSRNYWLAITWAYISNENVRVMEDVVIVTPKVDKQAEAIYSQLIAESRGLC